VRRNDLYNCCASAIIVSLLDHLQRVTAEGDTVFLRDNSRCVTAQPRATTGNGANAKREIARVVAAVW